MKRKTTAAVIAILLSSCLTATPVIAAEPTASGDDGIFYVGSVLLSILHLPLKLVTCVGTQAGAAVAYTATYNVPGNYDGGTNGREIGEVARKSCTGPWIITPDQVRKDYSE
jgi:hypothetical protein